MSYVIFLRVGKLSKGVEVKEEIQKLTFLRNIFLVQVLG